MLLQPVSHIARGSMIAVTWGLLAASCASAPPTTAAAPPPEAAEAPAPAKDAETNDDPAEEEANGEKAADDATTAEAGTPEFRPGMSVEEARRAVPQGASRANLEDDFLAAPLQEAGRFDRCGFSAKEHFTVTVAIWEGAPVGIDVVTKSTGKAACVREVVEGLRWRSPTKALNTITFTL